jgi:hypothetical protein
LASKSKFANANSSLDNSVEPVELIVIDLQEALKGDKGKFTQRVQIVIVLIFDVRMHVTHDVRVFFESIAVRTLLKVVQTANLLEPETLVVVNVLVVTAVLEEDRNCVLTLLDLAGLHLIAGSNSVQCTISLVQHTSLLEKARSLSSITCYLHDLSFECVQINQCWRVLNSLINVLE